jgi:hypothetical protein
VLTEQPRPGERVVWPSGHGGKVLRIEGNLCWVEFDDGTRDPFIWRFKDGLNNMATIVRAEQLPIFGPSGELIA